MIRMIRWYQKKISPLLPDACRFTPSCSNYAIQAIQVHGGIKGGILGFWRILRCNPWTEGGYDPIPQKGRWRHKDLRELRFKTPLDVNHCPADAEKER